MRLTEIEMDYKSNKSVKSVIQYLKQMRSRLENNMSHATHKVADRIEAIAGGIYETSEMDVPVNPRFEPDSVNVSFNTIDENDSSTLIAGGDAVWSEFGAGVHFNANDSHEWRSGADGVVGIGEYGNKHGMEDSWKYPVALNDGRFMARTYGTPQSMALYRATMQVKSEMQETAQHVREAIGTDK